MDLKTLHIDSLIHRWKIRKLECRNDISFCTKMDFMALAKGLGINWLEIMFYLKLMAPMDSTKKIKRRKLVNDAANPMPQALPPQIVEE